MNTTQYLEAKIANYIRGTTMGSAPSSLKLALSTADPTDTGGNLTQPVNDGYAAQTLTLGSPVTNEDSGSVVSNSADIVFTAGGDVSHFAVLDNADNVLFYAPLAAIRTIADTDTITFATGAIQLAFKGLYSKYFAEALWAWIKGSAMPTAPVSLKLALSTANPKRDASGIAEPDSSTGGYHRQTIAFAALSFTSGVGTALESNNAQVFGPCTNANWGAISHFAIYDQGSNQLFQGALSAPKNIPVGQGYGVNAGGASILLR